MFSRKRFLLLCLVLGVLAVLSTLIVMTNWVSQTARTSVGNNLQAALNSAHNNFSFFIDNQIDNAEHWAKDPELIAYTHALLGAQRAQMDLIQHPAQNAIRYLLRPFLTRYADRGYFVITLDNLSIASSRNTNIGTTNLLAQYPDFLNSVKSGKAALSPLMRTDVPLEDIDGVMRDDLVTGFVVAPMYDDKGDLLALLALRLDIEKIFDVALDQERIGTSGEIYAVNEQGVMLSRSRFEDQLVAMGLLAQDQKSSLNVSVRDPDTGNFTRMAQSIAAHKDGGQLTGYADYRGVIVVGQWVWDEALSLGLAIEMDYAEAFRQYENIRHILVLGAIVVLVIIFVLFHVWRARYEERQRFVQEIEASEKRIRTILETTDEGFWLIDEETRVLEMNPAMCRILGLEQEDVLGRPICDFVDDDNRKIFEHQLENRAQGESNVYEIEILHATGPSTPCIFNATPIYGEHGHMIGSFALVNNIFALKEHERTLEKAVENANQANQAKSNFLSSMSHELRTPLNAILGFAQLLDMRLEDEKNLRFTRQIITGGEHLLELINQVLDLSRIEQGRLNLSIERLSVGDLIRDCITIVTPMAQEKKITLTHPAFEEGHFILADYLRIKQCLLNLLSNAIKYNKTGGYVAIEIRELHKDFLRIQVVDSGRGISEDKMSRVFKPFDRLDMEKYEIEGTGIGLTLSKKLIEDMSGRIGFKSLEGRGSTFWLDIAADKSNYSRSGSPLAHEPRLKSGEELLGKYCLLYVEDDLDNVSLLEMIIDEIPALEMISVSSAEAGLELVQQYHFDIIIMDINLPGMSGIEAVREMRKASSLNAVPIIALSADIQHETVDSALAGGFDTYLLKPVKVAEIYATLSELMNEKLEINALPAQMEKEVS